MLAGVSCEAHQREVRERLCKAMQDTYKHADMGHLGNWQHPDVWKAMEDAAKRILKAGKAPGILVGEADGAEGPAPADRQLHRAG